MTGAAVPKACDACVRLEDVVVRERDGGSDILISAPVLAGTNIRATGEDFGVGAEVLLEGQVIRSEDILCLAALGIQTISVYRKPRVAIIATGRELSPPSQPLPSLAHVRNSTTSFLLAALRERGAEATFLGTVNDDPTAFNLLFDRADNGNYDLIVTTGALSVGRHDFVASALDERRTDIFFRKVAVRPGKPVLFGQTKGGRFLLSLPGNPVASVLGLHFFVNAFLSNWLGHTSPRPLFLPLLDESLGKPDGVTSFFRASVNPEGVRTHAHQRASLLAPLLQTDAWVELHPQQTFVSKGELVPVWPFFSTFNRRAGSPAF